MKCKGKNAQRQVSFPVMPKGVEHAKEFQGVALPPMVSFPVMQKGVEHLAKLRCGMCVAGREFSCDAERR